MAGTGVSDAACAVNDAFGTATFFHVHVRMKKLKAARGNPVKLDRARQRDD